MRAVVVEMANPASGLARSLHSRHGADIARRARPHLRDATNPDVRESRVYEALLRAIRDVNVRLPADQRVRVSGGDSRVDWSAIKRPEERRAWFALAGAAGTSALEEREMCHVRRGDGLDELEAAQVVHALEQPFSAAE